MATRFDVQQLDARDRTWYYGLTPSYRSVIDWFMDNYDKVINNQQVHRGVSLRTIARGTGLSQATVRLAVAALEQFGYVTISWYNGQIWKVTPMHGFDLSESED